MKGWKLLFSLPVLILLISGCSGTEPVQEEQTVTMIRMMKPENIQDFTSIVKSFNEDNKDIQIKFVDAPSTTERRHSLYVSSLAGKDASIDIFWLNDEWIREFAAEGYLESLDINQEAAYMADADERFSVDGIKYAAPIGLDADMLYYKNDIITAPPGDWNEIMRMSEQDAEENICMLSIESNDMYDIIYNISTIKNLTDLTYAEAAEFYKKAVRSSRESGVDAISAFKTGSSAMMFGKISSRRMLNSETSAVRGSFSVTSIFGGGEGYMSAYGLGLNSNSMNKETALKVIQYFSSKDIQGRIAREYGIMPVIKELYDDEMILDGNPYFKEINNIIEKTRFRSDVIAEMKNLVKIEEALTLFLENSATAEEVENAFKTYFQ